ncbi:endonuclease-8 [Friedmanniella endophytica]|uniref:DNA-(apurinic or apyrimidinic site) lyase n=1 Tax=Microlunatus kandeliicorticis TaxID=1759536 RepID=A0A7W3ITM0_9ACTN|nr:Fpg/Nei family DNA glycosylase [Microlunatus kandeliicorticis]MBA8795039.1 endonuclease-8 [Microlunatus kandeliicorticis]
MPEGHTLHRLARRQDADFAGRLVSVSSPQGRFADGAALVDGHRLTGVTAYGKHLFQHYDGGLVTHVHLGLYGKFTAGTGEPPEPRGALRMRIETADHDQPVRWTDLRGAITCEVLPDPDGPAAVVAKLGPDPLRRDPGAQDRAFERINRSRTSVGAQLMDQARLAGVGNVYRAEILFRHRISPFRPGRGVTADEWSELWPDLVTLMRAGVRSGRIVTTDPADRPAGRVRRDTAHYVYRRDGLPCRVCGTTISRDLMAGRNLFWCPSCQRD